MSEMPDKCVEHSDVYKDGSVRFPVNRQTDHATLVW